MHGTRQERSHSCPTEQRACSVMMHNNGLLSKVFPVKSEGLQLSATKCLAATSVVPLFMHIASVVPSLCQLRAVVTPV